MGSESNRLRGCEQKKKGNTYFEDLEEGIKGAQRFLRLKER